MSHNPQIELAVEAMLRRPAFLSPFFYSLEAREQELSREAIHQFRAHYIEWREQTLNSFREVREYFRGVGTFAAWIDDLPQSPIGQTIEIGQEEDVTRALLQMVYFDDEVRINKSLPYILIAQCSQSRMKRASNNLESALQYEGHYNVERLLGARTLGLPVRAAPTSLVSLFVDIANGQDHNVYKKDRLFAAMNRKVHVQQNDLEINHPYSGETGFTDFFASEVNEVSAALSDLIDRRKELLLSGLIYVKPHQGARATGVTRLAYDGEKVTLNTLLPNFNEFVRVYSSETIAEIVFNGRRDLLLPTDEHLKYEWFDEDQFEFEGHSSHFKIDDPEFENIIISLCSEYEGMSDEVGLFSGTYDGPMTYHALAFWRGFQFVPTSDCTYEIPMQEEDLERFLMGLECCSMESRMPSYAEEAIKTVTLDGKTWEIRVINIDASADGVSEISNARPFTAYVKIGENDFVANISRGGQGSGVRDTVERAYKQLRPDFTEDQVSAAVQNYMEHVNVQASEAVESISDYFTAEKDRLQIPFPLDRVFVDSVSTDFIAEVVEGDEGNVLRTKLVDCNLLYGFSGLKNADSYTHLIMMLTHRAKKRQVATFVEDHHMSLS